MLLNHAFKSEGYAVYQAENGSVAQKMLSNGLRPTYMLLDLMMPVMGGRDFLEWKNKQSEFADFPVFVISASQRSQDLEGTTGYIRKPIDLGQMFDLLESCGTREVHA